MKITQTLQQNDKNDNENKNNGVHTQEHCCQKLKWLLLNREILNKTYEILQWSERKLHVKPAWQITLKQSLNSKQNTVAISLIVWRNDNMNNKAHEVNSRPINTCAERSITFIDPAETTGTEKNLNESKLYLK